jgi:hypothetical protein
MTTDEARLADLERDAERRRPEGAPKGAFRACLKTLPEVHETPSCTTEETEQLNEIALSVLGVWAFV